MSGRVHVVWQAWREGSFDIWAKALDGADIPLCRTAANEWNPAMAFDSKGVLHVAYDTYERGSYDVKLASVADGRVRRTLDIAASPRFEARASVAVDKQDRVWVAFEDSDPNWAKDYGSRWQGKSGIAFYIKRNVIVRCVSDGKLQAAAEVKSTPVETNYLIGLPTGEPLLRISFPRLGVDEQGRVWLLFRRHPVTTGAAERWASYATYYDGGKWATETPLLNSDNLLDNRPALAALRGGGLLVVYSHDGRTGGTNTATENNLRATVLAADGEVKSPVLAAASAEGASAEPVHPNEAKDIERVRGYRATVNGKTYQLLRGEFHRHTELTAHRDQDGALEEMWRYALDVARMDWIGNGDHMNGNREYCWWLVQKQTNFLHHPPTFIPMYTYERSVNYPSGHRNVMFVQRGIRPLPIRQGMGTPEEGAPDIKRLYQYLKLFDGICSSHTSATGMGTDWRDNDPAREPVVEIYQGHRQNYEHYGAPGSAKDAQDSIGGYQPAGFVWNALQRGYRLGFQVSSDHVSTHLSYGIVYAETPTREGILDGFKRRHSYGANDNIILDVRCGEHLMGDE
ncbi:MAG: hypothetical protein FJ279_36295, partial [Planctomycetes bacterium]|nr:hypothetical protein [Planctomycetota bacterium]